MTFRLTARSLSPGGRLVISHSRCSAWGPSRPPRLRSGSRATPPSLPQATGALFRPRRFAIELCSIPAHLFRAHARRRGRVALIARPNARLTPSRRATQPMRSSKIVRALHALTKMKPDFFLAKKTGLTLKNVGTRIFFSIFVIFRVARLKKKPR